MKRTDDITLPPLPKLDPNLSISVFFDGARYVPGYEEDTVHQLMTSYARAAVEADRLRTAVPGEQDVQQFVEQIRAVLREAEKQPGKVFALPDTVHAEYRKFMADEPSIFDRIAWGEFKNLTGAFASSPAPAECDVPPLGWHCTRAKGHEGPCAAVSIEQTEAPAGWQLVPIEPTIVMQVAGNNAFRSYAFRWMQGSPAVWDAMLAAAPKP